MKAFEQTLAVCVRVFFFNMGEKGVPHPYQLKANCFSSVKIDQKK